MESASGALVPLQAARETVAEPSSPAAGGGSRTPQSSQPSAAGPATPDPPAETYTDGPRAEATKLAEAADDQPSPAACKPPTEASKRAASCHDNGDCRGDDEGPNDRPAAKRRRYLLVRLDEKTGTPLRPVTPEEVKQLEKIILPLQPAGDETVAPSPVRTPSGPWGLRPRVLSPQPTPPAATTEPSVEPAEMVVGHHHLVYNRASWHQQQKPGGPCDHCGAVESPQWRRGPADKPVLCNACGTRYRRTQQLGNMPNAAHTTAAAAAQRGKPHHQQAGGNIMVVCKS